jgi:hypothetical protein
MTTPQAYRRLFEDNADGAAVLDDLVRRFSQPQVSAGGIDAVLKTYERGGMRKVLDYILGQINQAHGVPHDDVQEDLDIDG